MNPDNDAIPQPESKGVMMAGQTPTESLDAIAREHLLRASEVQRFAGEAPLAIILQWVNNFLARPHPDVGSSGPVCPFTPTALALDTIWLTEIDNTDPDRDTIVEVIGHV